MEVRKEYGQKPVSLLLTVIIILIISIKWYNPALLDGSAPNLVIAETDRQDHVVYKRAFNTQACEQLTAWIGGFE